MLSVRGSLSLRSMLCESLVVFVRPTDIQIAEMVNRIAREWCATWVHLHALYGHLGFFLKTTESQWSVEKMFETTGGRVSDELILTKQFQFSIQRHLYSVSNPVTATVMLRLSCASCHLSRANQIKIEPMTACRSWRCQGHGRTWNRVGKNDLCAKLDAVTLSEVYEPLWISQSQCSQILAI